MEYFLHCSIEDNSWYHCTCNIFIIIKFTKENFSNQLTEFKKSFLTGKNREVYKKFYSKRKEISEMVKEKIKKENLKNSIKLIKNNDERI